jgi:hypothetical protein
LLVGEVSAADATFAVEGELGDGSGLVCGIITMFLYKVNFKAGIHDYRPGLERFFSLCRS